MSSAAHRPELSRRTLLQTGAASVLLYGFHLPLAQAASAVFAPNAFIRVAGDDKITLIMPQVEMGQGVYTSISVIMAEELDADFARLTLEHAPADEAHYANPMLFVQATGNSNSIRAFWKPLRTAGATARAMLVTAAAKQWLVDAASCTTAASHVIHAASGRQLSYGALAAAAARMPLPTNVLLKDPRN